MIKVYYDWYIKVSDGTLKSVKSHVKNLEHDFQWSSSANFGKLWETFDTKHEAIQCLDLQSKLSKYTILELVLLETYLDRD